MSPKSKAVSAPTKKLTAAERKVEALAKAEQCRLEQAARLAEFEATRPTVFGLMYGKALRLDILRERYVDFAEQHSWWFDDLIVGVESASFSVETTGNAAITQEKLHPSDVARINSALDEALTWFTDFVEAQEAKRLEALRIQDLRTAAKAKLTLEEQKLLGIR